MKIFGKGALALLFGLGALGAWAGGEEGGAAAFARQVWGNHYGKHTHFQAFNERTYIALSSTEEDDPHVWAVDHRTGEWTGPVKIGENELPPSDQHGNPSMAVDSEGYVHVWYGGHGRVTSKRVYARSKEPEDISEWIHPDFETNMTYPMPILIGDGVVAVLYRRGNHSMPGSAPWVLQTSADNGETWSEPVVIVREMSRAGESDIYCQVTKYPGDDKIGIGIGDEFHRGSPSKHTTSHLFYVAYDVGTGQFSNAAGELVRAKDGLTIEQLRRKCLIVDYAKLGNRNKRIAARPAISADGAVHVLATNGAPAGFDAIAEDYDEEGKAATKSSHGGLPRVWFWRDGVWRSRDPGFGFSYFMAAEENALVAWKGAGGARFERIVSRDRGATWTTAATATLPAPTERRVGVLFNTGSREAHREAQTIFYEVGKSPNNRAWLWGGEGFLAPPANE